MDQKIIDLINKQFKIFQRLLEKTSKETITRDDIEKLSQDKEIKDLDKNIMEIYASKDPLGISAFLDFYGQLNEYVQFTGDTLQVKEAIKLLDEAIKENS